MRRKLSCGLKNTYNASSIVQNLIENGTKYRQVARSYSPFISIKNKVNILIRDNGQDMDKNVLKNAFIMFYRSNLGSEGSGLGLFIVKSSVEKLGGKLKIKSKVNEGTEIKITLPMVVQN